VLRGSFLPPFLWYPRNVFIVLKIDAAGFSETLVPIDPYEYTRRAYIFMAIQKLFLVYPEDGGTKLLQNFDASVTTHIALYSRRP